MVFLSSIPDLDLSLGIEHRGITYTFVFGLAVGVLIGLLFGSGGDWTSAVVGFIAGFGGTLSHLLGDAFTYRSFEPFKPFSDKEVAYGFFEADNETANRGFMMFGIITFVLALVFV